MDEFSVFDSFTLTSNGSGHTWAFGAISTTDSSREAGAAVLSASRQYLNITNVPDGTELPASAGDRLAAPLALAPSAPGSGLTSLDLALADGSIAFDTTTSSSSWINPVVRIRLDSRAAGRGKTSRPTLAPLVPAVDAAALDALLGTGWRARSSWVADRTRQSIKKFL
jgi:hypothetical protein